MTKKWNFKTVVKEIALGVFLLFILSNIISYIRKPELNSTQLAMTKAPLIDGSMFRVTEGKPLVIHFWATWCPTCKLEAGNIQRVSEKYEVLSIAVQSGSKRDIEVYMQENELSFKVLNDPEGAWAKKFKVEAYPTTFIYDSAGELKFTEVGYTSTAGLLARLGWL
ncbi:redoxin domain-containing protein [Sulfurovum sp.]|uniref:redoxin domain-containing protein n=1 Tax=Sulfurovum sp. TaxID=1969726 RepID=UPI002868397E|nr:redoxin domain-containing protein [Sulfurovum sp.]